MSKLGIDVLTEVNPNPAGWFKRYELAIELYAPKIEAREGESEVDLRLKHLPLYLGGQVLVTFEQLTDGVALEFAEVKEQLLTSYQMSGVQAYSRFTSLRFHGGSIDMHAAELRRLLDFIPGMRNGSSHEKEALVVEQLLSGLPEALATNLRLISSDVKTGRIPLESVLQRARLLPNLEAMTDIKHVNATRNRMGGSSCFKCGQSGHIKTNCPLKESVCYKCGKPGHLKKDCPSPNGRGGPAQAAQTTPRH